VEFFVAIGHAGGVRDGLVFFLDFQLSGGARGKSKRLSIPERLYFLLRAGDDHRVKAKEESSERGGDGPKDDAAFYQRTRLKVCPGESARFCVH
jgi:hypothetical protein